ncbi:MAG TPA: hypothetical protein VMB79_16890 [Jatrophihabitans sp.]|nr:hypothetical protein [Jatrophihabitans sp.]
MLTSLTVQPAWLNRLAATLPGVALVLLSTISGSLPAAEGAELVGAGLLGGLVLGVWVGERGAELLGATLRAELVSRVGTEALAACGPWG